MSQSANMPQFYVQRAQQLYPANVVKASFRSMDFSVNEGEMNTLESK